MYILDSTCGYNNALKQMKMSGLCFSIGAVEKSETITGCHFLEFSVSWSNMIIMYAF